MKCSLYKSEEGSDLTLICASSEFRVHSYMLTMRSTWFTAACDGNFKV